LIDESHLQLIKPLHHSDLSFHILIHNVRIRKKKGNLGFVKLQNLLFLHPSDGLGSLAMQEKLTGVKNYRSWRRNIEIALATKKKLGFVQVIISRQSLMMI